MEFEMPASQPYSGYTLKTWSVVLSLLILVLLTVAYSYYQIEARHIRQQKCQELAAIAKLKVGQIIQWRRERLGDVERSVKSPLYAKALQQLIQKPDSEGTSKDLKDRLLLDMRKDVYSDILLLDITGDNLLGIKSDTDPVSPATKKAFRDALRLNRAVVSEFYICPSGRVHIDFAAPVCNAEGRPLAVQVFRTDARNFLYPMIQSWPTTSPSAETIIVTRQGDDVLFLSPLKNQINSALSLRVPLSRKEVPAVQAVLGRTGVFEGRDYKGDDVLAFLKAVPDSDWSMVAKVDADEIMAEVYYRAYAIALVVIILIAFAASSVAFAHRQQRVKFYKNLYKAEHEKREAHKIFRTTLYSIGDAVITTGVDGTVLQMNPVAEALTGWTETEARNRKLREVFRIINEDSRQPAENPVETVMREGRVVGLANHTILIAKDGTEHPIADSGAPIRGKDDLITGVVLVFRDQALEREAQKSLLESELQYRTLADSGQALIWTADTNGKCNYFNRTWLAFTGRTISQELGDGWLNGLHHDDAARCMGIHSDAARLREKFSVDYRLRRYDGVYRWIEEQGSPRFDSLGNFLGYIGHCLDITGRKQAEEELRESEERFRRMFRRHNAIMLLVDPGTGAILNANHAAAKFYGYEISDLCRMAIQQINSMSDEEVAQQRLLALEEKCNYFIFDHVLSNGETKTVEVHSSPITTRENTILFSIIHDITERKRAEDELNEKTRTLESVFESAPYIMMLVNGEGRVSYINRVGEEFTGKSRNDLLGLFSGEAFECINSIKSNGCGQNKVCETCPIRSRFIHTETTGEPVHECEGRMEVMKDGRLTPIDILVSTSLIQTGGDRKVLVTIADVTRRKQAEEERARLETARRQLEVKVLKSARELAESEKKFRIIAENTDDLFWLMDADERRYLYISPACEAIFGMERSVLYNSPGRFLEMIHPDDQPMLMQEPYSKAKQGPVVLEYRIIRPDGETRWILDKITPVVNEDGLTTMLAGVCRDVTENRFMQRQLIQNEKLATLGTLSASIAHEINNPNSFIVFNLPILKDYVERLLSVSDSLPMDDRICETWCGMAYNEFREDAMNIFSNISHGAFRIKSIISDLQDFSRYKEKIEKTRSDVGEIITNAIKMCRPRFKKMIKSLNVEVQEGLPQAFTDPQLVQQVLMNLVVNAAQASDKEDSWIRIKAAPSRSEPGHITIEVSDNGCGMDERTKTKIFDPFFTTKAEKEGTGLGLAICRNLVEALGGRIAVTSEKGRGSTFKILIPSAQLEGVSSTVVES